MGSLLLEPNSGVNTACTDRCKETAVVPLSEIISAADRKPEIYPACRPVHNAEKRLDNKVEFA